MSGTMLSPLRCLTAKNQLGSLYCTIDGYCNHLVEVVSSQLVSLLWGFFEIASLWGFSLSLSLWVSRGFRFVVYGKVISWIIFYNHEPCLLHSFSFAFRSWAGL